MEFSDNQPIYRQIVDYCFGRITSGDWLPGSRMPSTKDLSIELTVNNRTVLKAYDELNDMGVIYQRRGLGYYVADDARTRVLARRRKEFFDDVVPAVAAHMRQLGLTLVDIAPYLPE